MQITSNVPPSCVAVPVYSTSPYRVPLLRVFRMPASGSATAAGVTSNGRNRSPRLQTRRRLIAFDKPVDPQSLPPPAIPARSRLLLLRNFDASPRRVVVSNRAQVVRRSIRGLADTLCSSRTCASSRFTRPERVGGSVSRAGRLSLSMFIPLLLRPDDAQTAARPSRPELELRSDVIHGQSGAALARCLISPDVCGPRSIRPSDDLLATRAPRRAMPVLHARLPRRWPRPPSFRDRRSSARNRALV